MNSIARKNNPTIVKNGKRLKRVPVKNRYQKMREKELFYRQYNIYGKYVMQEEKDIDRAVEGLNKLVQSMR